MNQNNTDKTKQLLGNILSELYKRQSNKADTPSGSFLIAQNGQFLGKITNNIYDNDSLLNKYGPYGSQYSQTSIFNKYSEYGSQYGQYSLNNPYCSVPPKLFINGKFFYHVSDNKFISDRISSEIFFYNLQNNVSGLEMGQIIKSENELRIINRESFIEGGNKIFLGSLNPNQFDNKSIFNRFSPYGNKFSPTSIFNQFSVYGSLYSDLSANNVFANNPPKIYLNGNFRAFLTNNNFKNPRIRLKSILEWAKNNVTIQY